MEYNNQKGFGKMMRDMEEENACLLGSFDISLIAKEEKYYMVLSSLFSIRISVCGL